MKIVPYDREKLLFQRHYKRTKNLQILEEFMDSDEKCVQLIDYEQCNAKSCQSSFQHSIQNFGFVGVRVVTRGDNVFLVKTEM